MCINFFFTFSWLYLHILRRKIGAALNSVLSISQKFRKKPCFTPPAVASSGIFTHMHIYYKTLNLKFPPKRTKKEMEFVNPSVVLLLTLIAVGLALSNCFSFIRRKPVPVLILLLVFYALCCTCSIPNTGFFHTPPTFAFVLSITIFLSFTLCFQLDCRFIMNP